MIDINSIYEKEKVINAKFRQKYDYNDEDIFYKQVLELVIEISELAYETKCFKYWKNDKASSAEVTIAEYADCLMITLCLCDLSNTELGELVVANEDNIVMLFIKLHNLASQIKKDIDKQLLLEILSNLLALSKLLGFSDEELEKHCYNKMDKTLAMISEQL